VQDFDHCMHGVFRHLGLNDVECDTALRVAAWRGCRTDGASGHRQAVTQLPAAALAQQLRPRLAAHALAVALDEPFRAFPS
jgi:hypothetical protein